MQDLLHIEVKDLLLPDVDFDTCDVMMVFTCGSTKNGISYKEKSQFTMKVFEGPKSNYLKVELSKGNVATMSKASLLATVRISVEELVAKSASIDQ